MIPTFFTKNNDFGNEIDFEISNLTSYNSSSIRHDSQIDKNNPDFYSEKMKTDNSTTILKDKLRNGKTIKDFNLFWIALSFVTSLNKDENFSDKYQREINFILFGILEFYSDYVFKNRFNMMKLSLIINEVLN